MFGEGMQEKVPPIYSIRKRGERNKTEVDTEEKGQSQGREDNQEAEKQLSAVTRNRKFQKKMS